MPDAWNPDQYGRFAGPRSKPFFDLLALVDPRPGMRVVDLGCGTGTLTAEMHRLLGARETLGIDRSAAMLAQAPAAPAAGLAFAVGEICAFAADPAQRGQWDLVFSNAALHWVPDHQSLIERLAGLLTVQGQLAVQVPAMHQHLAHRLAAELAASPRFAGELGGYVYESDVFEPEAYAELLDELGFREQQVRLQIYGNHLNSRDEVADWLAGSLLTTYQERLSAERFAELLAEFRRGLAARLPDRRPFFYGYRRILFWGQR